VAATSESLACYRFETATVLDPGQVEQRSGLIKVLVVLAPETIGGQCGSRHQPLFGWVVSGVGGVP
jgi:hypothetical protein